MSKIDTLRKQLEIIKIEINNLGDFRDTPLLRRFRRQLEGEKSVILEKITRINISKEKQEQIRLETQEIANKNRSEKMKRTWRYLRAIQKNYPTDLSLRELRSAYKKHRQGLETDISDVAWRNPSP